MASLLSLAAPGGMAAEALGSASGLTYTNIVDSRGPWSIHVVKWPRKASYEIRSVHARGRAIGLGELSEQTQLAAGGNGEAVAAVNGDFYQRDGSHAGDPRGLQIVDGELVSAPSGSASFWIDAAGQPHIGNTTSDFKVIWADGSSAPIGLNGDRDQEGIELYTPAIGRSTRAERGRELTLEPDGANPLLPLRPGKIYKARVRSVRDGANGEVAPGTCVLSIGPVLARELLRFAPGTALTISTGSTPDLRGARTAASGGPVLVREGKAQRFGSRLWRGDETASQSRRHPRSAVGFSQDSYFLVEVDGRQRRSVGMTLGELSEFLVSLGCLEAMNLDGGGSSTLWYKGRVRNNPCDGEERPIANSLVVVEQRPKETARAPAGATP